MSAQLGRGNLFARGLEGVALALDSVRANKMRASLTILGIAIGVMVVIAMASMITGIQSSVTEVVQRAGPKSFYVMRFFRDGPNISDGSDEMSPWRRRPQISRDEAEMIRRLPGIEAVNIRESTSSRVSYGDKSLEGARIDGVDETWMQVEGGRMIDGRNFGGAENAAGSYVVVVNDKAAEALVPGLDPVGKIIKIFGVPFTIVGLYEDPSGLFGNGGDEKFIIPHSTFVKAATFSWGWMNVAVFPADNITQVEAIDRVTAAMRVKRGLKPADENNFDVISGDQFLDSFNSMTAGFFLVMLALSSVGLMVGGVGVIAIMMISVTERTREIGVRMALGATRGEILFQFLVEAATLTLLGGLCGMAMGGTIAWGIHHFTPIPASVPLWSVAAAIIASLITGVCFGLYPANKAARLDPVEALRYE